MDVKLQIADCVKLYNFYQKNSYDVPYMGSGKGKNLHQGRAIALGLINEDRTLQMIKGKRVLDNFERKLGQYKTGIPWHEYFLKHEKQCLAKNKVFRSLKYTPWTRVDLPQNVQYITNNEIIIAGKIILRFDDSRIMEKGHIFISDYFITDACDTWDDTWIEVRPHTFCWDLLSGRELLWMADRTQEIWIPVQAKYVKFVLRRFAQKVFFYVQDAHSFVIVKAPPTKKIPMYKNTAACIQPMKSVGDFKLPDTIDAAWEGKFRDGERKLV